MGTYYSIFEIQANGSNSNSGMFDPNAIINTTLSTSNGTSIAPSVTASNYTFVSADIGDYLFIKSGTNWNPGWYRITAVNAGAATVDAAIGNVFQPNHKISTIQGVSTTSSASSGNWTIDYSQVSTAYKTYTDLVITPNTSTIQSTANPFTVNMLGNSIRISGGVNFTTGVYIISSLSGSNAVLDRAVGTVGATGGTGSQGGALLDWQGYHNSAHVSNQQYAYIKGSSGTFNWSGTPTVSVNNQPTVIGYSSVRGDFGKATIKLAASSVAINSTAYIYASNLIIDGQNNSGTTGIANANNFASGNEVVNCDFKNLAIGINIPVGADTFDSTFENCTNCSLYNMPTLRNCVIKNSSGNFYQTTNASNNIIINHGSTCFYTSNYPSRYHNNTFYNITGDAIYIYNSYGNNNRMYFVENNIFSNISGYAINSLNTGQTSMNVVQNNAYISITSGFHSNTAILNAGNNPPYTSRNNVALSVTPFVSATNLDFRLNNEIGGGRSCRGGGRVQSFPLTTTTSSTDIGAVQTTSYAVDKVLASTTKSVNMKDGTTSYSEYVYMASTGYTSTTTGFKAYYIRQNAAPVAIGITGVGVTASFTSGGFCEVDANNLPGLYRFDVPNAVFSSGVQSAILHLSNLSNNDKTMITYKFNEIQMLDLTQTIPTSNTPQTVGDALNAARAQGFGKWVVSGKTLNLYAPDGTTIIRSFTLNSATEPTSRT